MWDLWWTKVHWWRFSPTTSAILIPPTDPHSASRDGTIGQIVADVPSGFSFIHNPKKLTTGTCHSTIRTPVVKWYTFYIHYRSETVVTIRMASSIALNTSIEFITQKYIQLIYK
jgi:hypothetical protein